MGSGEETDDKDQSAKEDDDGSEYLDRSKLDFDPDDGLYTGTAVEGTSDIPGPHDKDDDDDEQEQQGDPDQ